MKKIFIAIAMMLAGMTANAQMSEDFKTFTLGEFVFKNLTPSSGKDMGGGIFRYWVDNRDEDTARDMAMFIGGHKEELEKKYNVIIRNVTNEDTIKSRRTGEYVTFEMYYVTLTIYDADAFNRYMKRIAVKEKMQEQERARKMSELEKIISE